MLNMNEVVRFEWSFFYPYNLLSNLGLHLIQGPGPRILSPVLEKIKMIGISPDLANVFSIGWTEWFYSCTFYIKIWPNNVGTITSKETKKGPNMLYRFGAFIMSNLSFMEGPSKNYIFTRNTGRYAPRFLEKSI